MARKKKRTYMKRDARKRQIYNLLLGAARPVSRNEILKHLKMESSSWTNDLFQEMVQEGYLLPPTEQWQGNKCTMLYLANDLSREFKSTEGA